MPRRTQVLILLITVVPVLSCVALIVGGAAVSIALFRWINEPPARPPTDAMMVAWFESHQVTFETLVDMSLRDEHVIRIAPTFTRLEHNRQWPRPISELGFSEDRWTEYRGLFADAGLPASPSREPDGVFFPYWLVGLVTSGAEKGYVHLDIAPRALADSLDDVSGSTTPRGTPVFSPLRDGWYLYYY